MGRAFQSAQQSLASARRVQIYIAQKGYYDGHDRADVVKDRQTRFLPAMANYREQLVEYTMGNPTEEIIKTLPPGVR